MPHQPTGSQDAEPQDSGARLTGHRPGPRHTSVTGRDVLVFGLELATYGGVGVALGRHQGWWLGLLGVLAMALWWGSLHSPKARWPLPAAADRPLRLLWFSLGLLAWLSLLD